MGNNILIVDDERLVAKSLQRVFRGDGYNIHVAESGQRAIEIMETVVIDIVLTDQLMPEMSGIELLSIVKERWPNTVKIILSGYADEDDVASAIEEGIVDYFVNKPWEDDVLKNIVKTELEKSKTSPTN